jgi:hypothetical protein
VRETRNMLSYVSLWHAVMRMVGGLYSVLVIVRITYRPGAALYPPQISRVVNNKEEFLSLLFTVCNDVSFFILLLEISSNV